MSKGKRIILFLAVCILAGSLGYLGRYIYDSYTAQSDVADIRDIVDKGNGNSGDAGENGGEAGESPTQNERYAPNGMLQGYYDAYVRNNDMVGWITVSGTKIDYPVMQRKDSNEYYLHKNFEREYSYSGLPFMDFQCDLTLPSDNIIIYAHNMKDGSMFAALLDYEDKEFYESHKIISFDTNYSRGSYEVFAVFSVKIGAKDEFKYYETTEFESEDEFKKYIKRAEDLSYYDTDAEVNAGDSILTLSTCSYNRSNERTVVMAKKIE